MPLKPHDHAQALFLGKEAARTAGFAKRVSRRTGKPVVVAAILSTGAAYTWGIPEARTQVAAQLNGRERKEFWRDVRRLFEKTSKMERDDESIEDVWDDYQKRVTVSRISPESGVGKPEEERIWEDFASKAGLTSEGKALGLAIVKTAAEWMKSKKLGWFVHTAYADVSSLAEYDPNYAKTRLEKTANRLNGYVMRFAENATLIFVDASKTKAAPGSFRTIFRIADKNDIAVFPRLGGSISEIDDMYDKRRPDAVCFYPNQLGKWDGWKGKKIILLNPSGFRATNYGGVTHAPAFHDDKFIRGFQRLFLRGEKVLPPSTPVPEQDALLFRELVTKAARTRFLRG
ncbi:Uncharacterised protein [Candidatus Norongarragalina meridionalis]|nr:Uncharacterised protein [Candidatus Norongarragalina meridionalis]